MYGVEQEKTKNSCGLSLLFSSEFLPFCSIKKPSQYSALDMHHDVTHQMFPALWVLCGYLKEKSQIQCG